MNIFKYEREILNIYAKLYKYLDFDDVTSDNERIFHISLKIYSSLINGSRKGISSKSSNVPSPKKNDANNKGSIAIMKLNKSGVL